MSWSESVTLGLSSIGRALGRPFRGDGWLELEQLRSPCSGKGHGDAGWGEV